MIAYQFDSETKEFLGAVETELDPLESEAQGKDVYLLPANSTFEAPPEQMEGYSLVYDGDVWRQKEDHRGVQYWLQDDEYDAPAREMKELGPLPSGATLTPPQPSKAVQESQIQQSLTDAVQEMLDTEAESLGYDSCLSVCSYSDTGVAKFDDEGRAFRAWRSAVWAMCYKILDEVRAGARPIPTKAELLAELPKLTVVYSEGV